MVGVHVRVDAVSEVRDPAFSSEPFGHLFDHLVDALRRSVEGAGVEVTLKRDVVADERELAATARALTTERTASMWLTRAGANAYGV